MEEAWAQLVSTTDLDSDPIMITKSSFTLGRTAESDLSFVGNKLISGKHCIIERDPEGRTWIQDVSTNGTLLCRRRKVHKERSQLHHGDEVFLIFRKDRTDLNISYLFQNLEELKKETSTSYIEDSSVTDVATSDSGPLETSYVKPPKDPSRSKLQTQESKRKHSVTELPGAPVNKRHCPGDDGDAGKTNTETVDKAQLQPAKSTEASQETNKAEKQLNDSQESEDEIEQSLVCIICQEIFHQCVSLQPCMHSYCAGCYSDWMGKSDECPSCRSKVVRINKNHLVNNLVEAYLKKHPKKKRDPDDVAELERKNKITSDMLYPARSRVPVEFDHSDESYEDEEEEEDDNDDDEDNLDPYFGFSTRRLVPPPPTFYTPPPGYVLTPPPGPRCRQCPGYIPIPPTPMYIPHLGIDPKGTGKDPVQGTSAGSSDEAGTDPAVAGASTATQISIPDGKSKPTAPPFVCKPNQIHIMCNCCFLAFPDRRQERLANPTTFPPTQCELCDKLYCHAYWGCNRINCLGCIGYFKDMNFGKECLKFVILENIFESGVLENYLKTKSMSVKDMVKICLNRMEAGAYFTLDQRRATGNGLNGGTALCYNCGLRNFRELAYQFRRDIPKDQLPGAITSRTDCHWGKNCRTQKHNINHATRYNHICEQTATPNV